MDTRLSPTSDQYRAVLTAAADVLGARQDRVLGVEEWAALARAVAACHGVRTADLLTERDLDDIADLERFLLTRSAVRRV